MSDDDRTTSIVTFSDIDPADIFNVLIEGLWVCDRDAITSFVNPRMAEILLTTTDAMIGAPLFDFYHDDDREMVKAKWRERIAGHRDAYNARLIRSDGSIAYVRLHVSPIERDGRVIGTAAAVTDQTDLHMVAVDREEALQSAEESKAATMRLLSWVSHELRTPLNTISGFAQLLLASVMTDTDRNMASNIVAASTHVNSLVQDLLDYARAEANALEPNLVDVSLSEAISEAVSIVASLAEQHDVRFTLNTCDAHVIADRRHVVQVLTNLLSNAVKYGGDHSEVTVDCSTFASHVRCQVRDNGPGIPLHLQRDIFRPFHRLDNSAGVSGAGLGLSICEAYTRSMGGTLTVQSQPGQGTTFTLELPDANETVAAVRVDDHSNDQATDNRTILYVEDEPLNAALVSSIVALLPGRELHVATTVAAGIAAARQLQPALVLLDLNLPDGTGFDVLSAIKAHPELCAATVYMLSADATEQSTSRATDLGADRFITKPFDLTEFLSLLEAATGYH